MGAVGITAEYDPFHSGHLAQLREVRRRLGEDTPVVAAVSGDFVQRGGPAAFSAFARAEAAVRCGVSLALELPLPWCASSAETFAAGGIAVLRAAGVVDTVCFGSECGEAETLLRCADALDDPRAGEALRRHMGRGISYAAARQRAAAELAGEDVAAALRRPNDTLGVAYIRAARAQGWDVRFLPVLRQGPAHGETGSASDLRARMREGEDVLPLLPPGAAEVFRREISHGRGPVFPEKLDAALLSRLRALPREALSLLPDASEGLENRLYDAIRRGRSFEEAAELARSKRYPLARTRRMLLHAALGVTAETAAGLPPYLRVLGMDAAGERLLREMRSGALLPVVNKPARAQEGAPREREIFALGERAHDLYVLGYAPGAVPACGEYARTSPFRMEQAAGDES